MSQAQLYRTIFLDHGAARLGKASAVIDRAIVIFSRITGLSYENAQLILIIIICYIVGIYILIKIHRKLFKKKSEAQKACTFEYDNIIYLIAQEEYKTNSDPLVLGPAQRGKGGRSEAEGGFTPIHALFDTKHKNYLQNHDLILNAIRKLEVENKHILFTPEMEKKIISLRKKIGITNVIQKIVGIATSIVTAGAYLLFR